MQFIEIKHIDAIEKGDLLVVQGISSNPKPYTVKQVKQLPDNLGKLIVLGKDKTFNIKTYLECKSWVNHVVKIIP